MYLPKLNSPQEEPDNFWFYETTFNEHIDFCVWVLQVDGLSVPPFSHHPDGDRTLQNHGLNAESWQAWLARVVIIQDPRLYFHVPNISEELQENELMKKSQIEHMVELGGLSQDEVEQIDWLRFRSYVLKRLEWQEQQYQLAVELLGDLPRNVTSPELWNGDAAVKEKLRELWQRYRSTSTQLKRDMAQEIETGNSSFLEGGILSSSDFQQYQIHLDMLKIYLVEYLEPVVEYAVPPVTILLSQTEGGHNIKNSQMRTQRVVERLIHLSN